MKKGIGTLTGAAAFVGTLALPASARELSIDPTPAQQQQQQQKDQQQHQQRSKSEQAKQREETQSATSVKLSELEQSPQRYVGQRIRVSGDIQDVLGPRVFKVDEANWADLDPELLVVMEAPLAALVKEDDRITVTGTIRPFVDVRLEREWGWIDLEPEIEARIKTRPVLVATHMVGSDPDIGMVVSVEPVPAGNADRSGKPTGTSGKMAVDRREAVTDLTQLAKATDTSLVGRSVKLSSVPVERSGKDGGFWVKSGGDSLFVLPADRTKTRVQVSQTVTIEGHVMRLPEHMERRLEKDTKVGNEEIYVYASSISLK